MRLLPILSVLFLLTLSVSCKKKKKKVTNTPKGTVVRKARGLPNGPASTATIGAEGGILISPDGRLTLTIQAGTVSTPTAFTIQPVSNALQSKAPAYRLLPEGVTFNRTIHLAYSYAGINLGGASDKQITLGFQDEAGYFHEAMRTQVNESVKQLTVVTKHFSDWIFFSRVELVNNRTMQNGRIHLKKNEQVQFQVKNFVGVPGEDAYSVDEPLLTEVITAVSNTVYSHLPAVGTLTPQAFIGAATYSAPAQIPNYQQVQVSAEVTGSFGSDLQGGEIRQMILTQDILLEPEADPSPATGEYFHLTDGGSTSDLKLLTANLIPGWIEIGGFTLQDHAVVIRLFGSAPGSYPYGMAGTAGRATLEYSLTTIDAYLHMRPSSCLPPNYLVYSPGTVQLTKLATAVGEYTEGSFSTTLYQHSWCGGPQQTRQVAGQFKILKRM